jgi:hypothetical protein
VRNEDLLPVHVFLSARSDDTYDFPHVSESLKTSWLASSLGTPILHTVTGESD